MLNVYASLLVVLSLSFEMLAFNHYLVFDKVVYYTVDENFSGTEKDYIQRNIKKITSRSCLQWKLRSEHYENIPYWVELIRTDGSCSTYVWPYPNTITISLAPHCFQDSWVLHELLHALGFMHEHQRPDRDCYVEIHSSKWDNPNYLIRKEFDITSPYDIHSVMHYRRGSYLIPAKDYADTNAQFGSLDVMSNMDAWTLNSEFCDGPKYCDNNKRECDEIAESIRSRGCIHNP